jgi:hypothetical protein
MVEVTDICTERLQVELRVVISGQAVFSLLNECAHRVIDGKGCLSLSSGKVATDYGRILT